MFIGGEDMSKGVNLVCKQFFQKMWTFWIKTLGHEDVDKNIHKLTKI
jgi:hypothetical protein